MTDLFLNTKLDKPLKKEELFNLIKEAQNGNISSRNKVVLHNIKLVIKKVLASTNSSFYKKYEKSELICIAILELFNVIEKYDVNSNFDFSTFASKCIENSVKWYVQKDKYANKTVNFGQLSIIDEEGREVSFENTLIDDIDIVYSYEEKELIKYIRDYVDNLTGVEAQVIKLYFGFTNDNCYTQRDIASMLNISKSYVSLVIKNTLEKIKKDLIKNSLMEKMPEKRKVKNGYKK